MTDRRNSQPADLGRRAAGEERHDRLAAGRRSPAPPARQQRFRHGRRTHRRDPDHSHRRDPRRPREPIAEEPAVERSPSRRRSRSPRNRRRGAGRREPTPRSRRREPTPRSRRRGAVASLRPSTARRAPPRRRRSGPSRFRRNAPRRPPRVANADPSAATTHARCAGRCASPRPVARGQFRCRAHDVRPGRRVGPGAGSRARRAGRGGCRAAVLPAVLERHPVRRRDGGRRQGPPRPGQRPRARGRLGGGGHRGRCRRRSNAPREGKLTALWRGTAGGPAVDPRGRLRGRAVHRLRPAVAVEQHRRPGALGAGHPRPGRRPFGSSARPRTSPAR